MNILWKLIPASFRPKAEDRPMHVAFFMRSGKIVHAYDVKTVEMTREPSTGQYSGYQIEWAFPKESPRLFTLSIPDIVAVVAEDM